MGTNVAVFSDVAEAIEICVFDDEANEERGFLAERSGSVFHGYLPDLWAGGRYGLRVHGPWDPSHGQRCDPTKLLIDPYAQRFDSALTQRCAEFLGQTLGDVVATASCANSSSAFRRRTAPSSFS